MMNYNIETDKDNNFVTSNKHKRRGTFFVEGQIIYDDEGNTKYLTKSITKSHKIKKKVKVTKIKKEMIPRKTFNLEKQFIPKLDSFLTENVNLNPIYINKNKSFNQEINTDEIDSLDTASTVDIDNYNMNFSYNPFIKNKKKHIKTISLKDVCPIFNKRIFQIIKQNTICRQNSFNICNNNLKNQLQKLNKIVEEQKVTIDE